MWSGLRHLPNLISALRILLVAPIVWALLDQRPYLAVTLFLVAGVSDAIDGFLAKRFGWVSRVGGILDALADKILLESTFACLWWLGVIPLWLVLLMFGRDLMIVVGGLLYNRRVGKFVAKPSLLSKLNTFLQIVLAAVGVVHEGIRAMPDSLLTGLIWLVALTVTLSGVGYIHEWGYQVMAKRAND